jgi:ArsR family metal-binding transcriptional regulator
MVTSIADRWWMIQMMDDPRQNCMGDTHEKNDRQKFKVVEFSPLLTCLGDPAKFRIIAQISPEPKDTLMVMDPLFEKATCSKKMRALLIKKENSIITLYSRGIVTMTRLKNEDHGRQLLGDMIDRINGSLATGTAGDIQQGSGARRQIDPFEINGYLPHSNCGKCGFKSCFFFATMLAFSEVEIEKCIPLLDESNTANREAVVKLIKSSG